MLWFTFQGDAYRPEYSELAESLQRSVGGVPVVALTGTATAEAIVAIQQLQQEQLCTEIVRAPMFRPNLFLSVEQKAGENMQDGQLLSVVSKAAKPCLIFLNSRHRCERKAWQIRVQFPQLRVCSFHAGMQQERKNSILSDAMNCKIDVMCCTVAFGMGVNVPVKSVIHWELPFNMESYVQAIGRAGRDGSIASCALFWNKWDVESLKRRVRSGGGAMNRRAKNALEVEKYCQLKTCRNLFIVNYFASVEDVSVCNSCDNCARSEGTMGG
jgi:ATP-dependent DNA helicase RecQ